MLVKWYLLSEGVLQEQSSLDEWQQITSAKEKECWFDIEQANPEELARFLKILAFILSRSPAV